MVVSSLSLFAQDTIIDTIYSIPELDGGIGYNTQWGSYGIDTTYGGHSVGDWYDSIDGGISFGRIFLAFLLPEIPENHSLNSATLYVYQYFSQANGEFGIYPIFNMETYDIEPPCLIEHIDFGAYLDQDDFNLPALHPADTISTTPEQGWRSLDVSDWVIDDIQNNRQFSQSRLCLSLDNDTDELGDGLGFVSGNGLQLEKPYIIYEFQEDNTTDNGNIDNSKCSIAIVPNPIRKDTHIYLILSMQQDIKIDLYNVKGQKVSNLFSGLVKKGRNQINVKIDNQNSGVYLIKLEKSESKSLIKKILIQK